MPSSIYSAEAPTSTNEKPSPFVNVELNEISDRAVPNCGDCHEIDFDDPAYDGLAALAVHNTSAVAAPASPLADGKRVLTEEQAYDHLGFSFPQRRKWAILTAVFIVQLSMNFNAAIYGTAIDGLSEQFGITPRKAEIGQAIFLICYAFGCELWAPWSEELGRKWVMQGSLLLVNIWQIPCALAPNFATIVGFRALGGLSSAGGSVTLGMVADMWEPDDQQYAVAYVVFSSVAGSVIAPVCGGFIKTYLSWHWVFWISLMFGAFAQFIHLWVPETRSAVLLDRHAKSLRISGEDEKVYGPNEIRGSFWQRTSWTDMAKLMWRPYKMLYSEPIVGFLSLLSGFSDALIFTGLDSYGMVMSKWNFSAIMVGLSFIPLLIGYMIGYASFLPVYCRDRQTIKSDRPYSPEMRLWWLLFLVPLEPLGLFLYGWSSLGPPTFHWIVPQIGAAMIGIANIAIYQATIDYMIAAYGPYSSSATGGNGFCRDLLAGIAAFYARPMYSDIKPGTKWQLPIPTFILCGIGMLLCLPVYGFYFKGEWFRKRSPFAQELEQERSDRRGMREEAISSSRNTSRHNSRAPSPELA